MFAYYIPGSALFVDFKFCYFLDLEVEIVGDLVAGIADMEEVVVDVAMRLALI